MDNICLKRNITSADAGTKIIVCGDKGILHSITIHKTSAQALTLYDAKTTSSPGGQFGQIKVSIAEQTLSYGNNGITFDTGLVIDVPTSYTGDAIVAFRHS